MGREMPSLCTEWAVSEEEARKGLGMGITALFCYLPQHYVQETTRKFDDSNANLSVFCLGKQYLSHPVDPRLDHKIGP